MDMHNKNSVRRAGQQTRFKKQHQHCFIIQLLYNAASVPKFTIQPGKTIHSESLSRENVNLI
jgi:hypothetical protein